MRLAFAILAAGLLLSFPAISVYAGKADMPALKITDAFAFATSDEAKTGAIFLTIANEGTAPDRLLGASAAETAVMSELHEMKIDENGVMQMRNTDGFDIHAGETLKLEPKGGHIMLTDLKKPLKEGDTFPVILVFDQTAAQTVQVTVTAAGKVPVPHSDHHMHMNHPAE